ncbi:hypothetical protein NX059_005383 [Plenodomus lindquistii]|nr:hypothetical protein NX059_005383 [Plenodomus lindquistii]
MSGFSTTKSPIDFDSVSFPLPTPEAEKWQPDPDSIARPGVLPDRRFNQDPFEPYRRAAARAVASASPESEPLIRGLGSWPAAVPRGTGVPRDLLDVNTPNDTPANNVSLGSRLAVAAEQIAAVQPSPSYRPLSPAPAASVAKTSPSKGTRSDWTTKLEKALAEDGKNYKSTLTGSGSIPLHPRKVVGTSSSTSLNPNAITFKNPNFPNIANVPRASNDEEIILSQLLAKAVVKEEEHLEDEKVAWQFAAGEAGGNHDDGEKDALQLQQDLLIHSTSSRPKSVPSKAHSAYEHREMAMLIRLMESELDLSKVATMHKLMAMSSSDIDSYYDEVRSVHQNWWEAKQAA